MLPDDWIEKCFRRFEDFYGSKWAAQYGSFPRERVKRTWGEELAGFADKPEAIGRALKNLGPFPPTLPEFQAMCRDAARGMGDGGAPKLTVILTPEEIERNRERAAQLVADLAASKRMGKIA